MYKFVFLILIFNSHAVNAIVEDTSRIKLLFAGDVMGHDAQIESAFDPLKDIYNYDTCFYFAKKHIQKADIAVANLEVTLAGTPYKGYPLFSSPDELADALKKAGFNLLLTANNHSMDRSSAGLERTIRVLNEKGIIRTGTFINQNQRNKEYPLIIEKNNIRLAILNYTYGTNGIPVIYPNIVNLIDTAQIARDLEKAASADPDFIFVTIHWGTEYERQENSVQEKLARFMFQHGANAIIGSHPHVVQPIRVINNPDESKSEDVNLVAYSLGNFISNQRKIHTDGGILLEIDLEKTDITRIKAWSTIHVWVYRPHYQNRYNFILLPGDDPEYLKELFEMTESDRNAFKLFINSVKVENCVY